MKRIVIITMLLCIAISSYAQQKSVAFKTVTESFKTSLETYETQFFTDFFELQKTGKEILSDSTIFNDINQKIFEAFVSDMLTFKAFSQEYKGKKAFKYRHKKIKGFEEEKTEYCKQFESLTRDYKVNRLTWTKNELNEKQTKEMMMKYITPVTQKLMKRIQNMQKKVKDL